MLHSAYTTLSFRITTESRTGRIGLWKSCRRSTQDAHFCEALSGQLRHRVQSYWQTPYRLALGSLPRHEAAVAVVRHRVRSLDVRRTGWEEVTQITRTGCKFPRRQPASLKAPALNRSRHQADLFLPLRRQKSLTQ